MVGRATSITGPYSDQDGKLMGLGGGHLVLEGNERYRGPGGQSVYLDGDIYRLVYHAYDTSAGGIPQLQIRDLVWMRDGWPTVREP